MTENSSSDSIAEDFARDIWCLFGLPVDNLTMASTKVLLRNRRREANGLVLATINVNWVVQSFGDPIFRDAILNSDLVSLDGRPLLWLAKLLGYPMTELVPGSTLIQELQQDKKTGSPLSLFLFGGDEGAAQQAFEQVNNNQGGLRAIGALNPGFGSVEEMSSDAVIASINQAEPDILLVALGARKGTRWIEHNRHRLNARVISHLGATINFLAGTVKRAPLWVRKVGMEWAWRILQEPKLFSRYASDGLTILRFMAGRFFLWRQYLAWQKRFRHVVINDYVGVLEVGGQMTLSLGRNLKGAKDSAIRRIFSDYVCSGKDLVLDFEQTEFADGSFMGLLLLLVKHQQRNGRKLEFVNVHGQLASLFKLFCVREAVH
ncbi:MAG: WecB/TagA/CpsF family glycosyltransferase [Desulfobulbaceae bacterium]|nr:WecB/TagA/CpsF family glycosyltransferase [Desulfobulbaceae bacterium]